MKIVSWNINGIRTFKGGIKNALESLDADIVCVQETKVTRDLLDERTAIVEGYNSYFSFSRGRSGYSGVATYCKDSATPFAAEEGLTGLLTTNHEGTIGCYGDSSEFSSEELQLLDNEGRAVLTQHRVMCEDTPETVTVINVYCPRADPEKPERKHFKLQFYKLLQCRAEAILEAGSRVIILGDVNTSHRPIDHCDPDYIDDFEDHPGRKWLNGLLVDDSEGKEYEKNNEESENTSSKPLRGGKFVDTFRHFHPTRSKAFTCWNTMTGARQTNYGTRIDYIFADHPLVKMGFVAADIMPEVEGSDHCPVWGKLCCPLLSSSKLPPLCTRNLPEFAGRQQKLSRFLIKMDQQQPVREACRDPVPGSQETGETRENLNPLGSAGTTSTGKKRKLAVESGVPKSKKIMTLKAATPKPQGNLLAFFKPKSVPVAPTREDPVSQCERGEERNEVTPSQPHTFKGGHSAGQDVPSIPGTPCTEYPQGVCMGDKVYVPGSNIQDASVNSQNQEKDAALASEATVDPPCPRKGASLGGFWKTVLRGPPPPPPCKAHGEPCVLRTVKKAGPNMGKQFFVCNRPQGHASNPEARCNYFSWVDKGK
ncbi:DNA-(apurinic or apyrimidinic site) endonuclease 2 [Oncorhynchus clarkii lewisi]|uniref:DNA-(apurinic or apyrimidinic site) endonuclease 2 n=1 Tax=Oncorhynchus clarkii lewisi TaxID=490388 RepID=UPI0039B9888E